MPSRSSANACRESGLIPKGSGPASRRGDAPLSQPPSIAQEIGRRIAKASKANPARVHTPFDFLDLGSPHSVGMALMRLVRSGALRRLARAFTTCLANTHCSVNFSPPLTRSRKRCLAATAPSCSQRKRWPRTC